MVGKYRCVGLILTFVKLGGFVSLWQEFLDFVIGDPCLTAVRGRAS